MSNKRLKKELEEEAIREEHRNSIIKKIVLIVILVAVALAIILVFTDTSNGRKELPQIDTNVVSERNNWNDIIFSSSSIADANITSQNSSKVKVTELFDGTLYSLTDEEIKPDIVIGDNFYDTQLADISSNFSLYDGKTIEIEGFYLSNVPYTFVGRYSESNLCAYCPQGYSYFEYEWHGDKKFEFTDEKEWLKIVGTLKKGNDGVDYYYIDVLSLEVMNEHGLDTVKN